MDKWKDKIPAYNTLVLPYHFARAQAAAAKYKFPGRKLKVIGVTGTNGKTTTCFMIWKMLNEAGHKTGLMTTVAWGVDRLKKQVAHMTTVDSETLNKRISRIARSGAEYLVLEVTSHAMAQFRTFGVPIEIAVLTNVTHDHLDYHKTFERYRDAKRKLFKKAKFGVINADDKNGIWFMQDVRNYITYGINHGQMRAKNVKLSQNGVNYSSGDIKKVGKLEISTQIPGQFNVYNSLAAACVGVRLGLSEEEISKGIAALESVEGRMNKIDEGQDFTVIVDYAHTPDAFLKVFGSVCTKRPDGGRKTKRVITVTGGAGRRDESTRFKRGEIAGRYSDFLIITEDDTRDEDFQAIAKEFLRGAEKAGLAEGKQVVIEPDRKKAIRAAVSLAKAGDIVLVLGKGHEKTILRADGPHKFEDLKVTAEAVREVVNTKK